MAEETKAEETNSEETKAEELQEILQQREDGLLD